MKIWKRLGYFLRRRRLEREMEQELRVHRQLSEDQFRLEGMSDREARHAASRALGNVTLALEDSRSAWNFEWLESLIADVRYALRGFSRAPTFAVTVIATVGLALGLNTILFTVFNAYVLKPFEVRDPYQLYSVHWETRKGGFTPTVREFDELREHNPVFSDLVGWRQAFSRADGHLMFGQVVSINYFSMLGVGAAIGRPLLQSDAAAGNALVLSYSAWQNKFGADPGIVGHRIAIAGKSYEVVGVAPSSFAGIWQIPPDFWAAWGASESAAEVQVIGRLRAGITPAQASAGLLVWGQQVTANRPAEEQASHVFLKSNATPMAAKSNVKLVGVFAPILLAFLSVLLTACANVANLMLARGMARQREIGVRLSLGAGRFRLMRQLLTESLVLALLAAAAGFAISRVGLDFCEHLLAKTLPGEYAAIVRAMPLEPDSRVFVFVLVAACLALLGFGLAPAIQATRPGLVQVARGDFSNAVRPGRLRDALVIAQVAFCALLLIATGVLVRAARTAANRDVGLSLDRVLHLQMDDRVTARQATPAQVADSLEAEPQIEKLAAVWRAPLYGRLRSIPIGQTSMIRSGYNFVSPEYFDVFRIPILRGRNFTASEAKSGAAVAVISQATAQRFWPAQDAIGQSVRIEPDPRIDGWQRLPGFHEARIIGIAGDVVSGWVFEGTDATCFYFPTSARRIAAGDSLLARVKGDPGIARRSLDTILTRSTPGAVDVILPMEEALAIQVYPFRVSSWIASFLGGVGLVLTISGIYGVLSYLVSQRTKEIGIRVALGASLGSVIRLVLTQSAKLAVVGILVGATAALGLSYVLASQFTTVNAFDFVGYAGGIVVVLVAAVAASFFPSRRAGAIDPASTLRYD